MQQKSTSPLSESSITSPPPPYTDPTPYHHQPAPQCADGACPSTHFHNTGAYNFAPFTNEATRTNKFPPDVVNVLLRIIKAKSGNVADNRFEDYAFLAKFAVAHQSHRPGLMPAMITQSKCWQHSKIANIIKKAEKVRRGVKRKGKYRVRHKVTPAEVPAPDTALAKEEEKEEEG